MDVNDFLAHHGVMGMKWGVRKDRRSIGGLGQRRASSGSSGKPGGSGGDKKTTATKTAYEIARDKKRLESTSDRDLQTLLTRLNMERQLKDFTAPQQSRGRRIAGKIIEASGKGLLKSLTRIVDDVAYKHGTEFLAKKGLLDALKKK